MLLPGLVAMLCFGFLVGYAVFAVNRAQKRRSAQVDPSPPWSPSPTAGNAAVPGPSSLPRSTPRDPTSNASAIPAVAPASPAPADDLHQPAVGGPGAIAGLAAGVALPCDLMPLTTLAPRPEANHRAAFITTTAPGEVVQRELEDAFEALGAQVSWYSADRGLVRRGDHAANVALFVSPALATLDGRDAFPTATPGSVVVDLWVE